MNSDELINRLEANADVIRDLVQGVSADQSGWRPAPDSWSILEVMMHLLDEEREDFRVRLGLLLHKPGAPWPGIDPQGWVTQREYARQDLTESLRAFLDERTHSIAWLRSLENPSWENKNEHPVAGSIAAGDMLSSWVAHDLLHARQLTKLHLEYVKHLGRPFTVDYAG